MRTRVAFPVVAALGLGVAILACGPSAETRQSDTTAAAAAKTRTVEQAGDVMSARREAQALFDGARADFAAGKLDAAAASLRSAAAFHRQHADSAAEPAKDALGKSAAELDALAAKLEKGAVKPAPRFDDVFARAHFADAQYHCLRAVDAWKSASTAATGAELTMLTDHFERAVKDAGQTLGDSAKAVVAEAQDVASKLIQGVPVAPARVDNVLSAIDKELHAAMKAKMR